MVLQRILWVAVDQNLRVPALPGVANLPFLAFAMGIAARLLCHMKCKLCKGVLLLFSIGFLLSCGFCCFARGAIHVFFKSFKKLKTG
jgi:hypothetical protein